MDNSINLGKKLVDQKAQNEDDDDDEEDQDDEQEEQNKVDVENQIKQKDQQGAIEKHKDPMDKIPPNFILAQEHRNVLRLKIMDEDDKKAEQENIGDGKTENMDLNTKECKCCGRTSYAQKLTMKSDNIDLAFLGAAYPMYFVFIKYLQSLLIIVLLVSGIFNIVQNDRIGDKCIDPYKYTSDDTNKCQLSWISRFTIGNRSDNSESMLTQEYLNLLTIIALIITIHFMMKYLRRLDTIIDIKSTSPSDYTVFFTDIAKKFEPTHKSYMKDFMYYLENEMDLQENGNKFDLKGKIHKVVFCFNINDLKKLEQKKLELLVKQQKAKDSQKNFDDKQIEKDIEEIQASIDLQEQYFYIANEGELKVDGETITDENKNVVELMKSKFIGKAFVCFKYENDCKEFLRIVLKSKQQFKFKKDKNKVMTFEQAKDPTDIIWTNLYTGKKTRVLRFGFGFFVNIFIVFIASLCIYKLAEVQYNYNSGNSKKPTTKQKAIIQIISIGISFLITVINEVLIRIVGIINGFKKFRMKTSEQVSFTIFLSSAQFINSTVIPIILLALVSPEESYYSTLYSPTGLILNQNSIFMTNSIMPLIMNLIDPFYRLKWFNRVREKKKGPKSLMTQREAQKLYEDPEFQLSTQYASAVKTIYMTMFYAPVMPMCILWSILAFIIQFITSKYLLIYKRVCLVSVGPELSYSVLTLLKIAVVIYSITSYYFMKVSNSFDRPYIPSIIGIVIAIINFCIPLKTINERIFKIDIDEVKNSCVDDGMNVENDLSYIEAQELFASDYDVENPALKRQFVLNKDKVKRKQQQIKIQKKSKAQRKKEKKEKKDQKNKEDKNKQEITFENKQCPQQGFEKALQNFNEKLQTNQGMIQLTEQKFGYDSTTVVQNAINFCQTELPENSSVQDKLNYIKKCSEFQSAYQNKFKFYEKKRLLQSYQENEKQELNKLQGTYFEIAQKNRKVRSNLSLLIAKDNAPSGYQSVEQQQPMLSKIKQFVSNLSYFNTQMNICLEYEQWILQYLKNYDRKLQNNTIYLEDIIQLNEVEKAYELLIQKTNNVRVLIDRKLNI